MKALGIFGAILVGFTAGVFFVYSCGGGGSSHADDTPLEARLATLEEIIEELTSYLTIDEGSNINGLAPPHVIITGANLHIRSGAGEYGEANGLGNLVVGYNEAATADTTKRNGSHNLVVGPEHEYPSLGGLVAGLANKVFGQYSTVTGGYDHLAEGYLSSISGGYRNEAPGEYASVSGGLLNIASGPAATVTGGAENTASGVESSVNGGEANTASGSYSSVNGGAGNTAQADWSSVGGGLAVNLETGLEYDWAAAELYSADGP